MHLSTNNPPIIFFLHWFPFSSSSWIKLFGYLQNYSPLRKKSMERKGAKKQDYFWNQFFYYTKHIATSISSIPKFFFSGKRIHIAFGFFLRFVLLCSFFHWYCIVFFWVFSRSKRYYYLCNTHQQQPKKNIIKRIRENRSKFIQAVNIYWRIRPKWFPKERRAREREWFSSKSMVDVMYNTPRETDKKSFNQQCNKAAK